MKIKNNNQMKLGALISYCTILANALFGLFVTPFILKNIGSSAYGVYKTMGSLSSSLLILDLGIGSTLLRYISKYRANSEDKKIGSFVSLMICESAIILPLIILVEVILYFQLGTMYSGGFSEGELALARQIYIILALNIVLNIVEHFLHGIISGYNNFLFGNGIKLSALLARIITTLILLPLFKSALLLVGINLLLTFLTTIVQLTYIIKKYHIHLNFTVREWETGIIKESFFYTVLIFLTTIAAQVNNNLDNVIIGAFLGAEKVTIYSFGLLIFGMFEQLSTAISGVALPTISKIVVSEDWQKRTQEFIVRMGRVQFMLLGAAVTGFAVLGNTFLDIWLGKGYDDVYWIILILMVPALFELCVNGCLSVLRAKNMLGFRTGILFLSTVLNLVISVVGIYKYGYFAAAFGTATSFLIGSLIIMNLYYQRKLKFNMLKIYREIFRGTFPSLVFSGLLLGVTSHFMNGTVIAFLINTTIFIGVFIIQMLIYGFTAEEKETIRNIVKKIIM